ncbi:serine/threonine protein kinase, partial [Verrucomicrobia bacterium]|nr:serine/threonine protein kinase [Verrucomicrobiota bacterium]
MKRSLIIALTVSLSSGLMAANWAQWRGPSFNGSTVETNLPSSWSKTKNVTWKTALPGESAATPIVWDDKVFLSSTDKEAETLLAMCFDRTNGKL